MIIKSIKLRNIRTYEEEEVRLPEGIILFEGGIGAGKSTLLLAIEFALFGLGNEKGTTLLSIGKNSGCVELTFETGGKEVKVHRGLERGKRGAGSRAGALHQGLLVPAGVKQSECWIEVDGVCTSYSPSEMKEQVLRILNYNEPMDPKAKSVIFRYAVYTPQEEMKEILSQPPDLRLQTIRKALRIEEYKTAMENARAIASDLRKEAEFIREGAERLPEIQEEIRGIEDSLPKHEADLQRLKAEVEKVEEETRALKERRGKLQAELLARAKDAEGIKQIDSDLQKARKEISELERKIAANKLRLEELRGRIKAIEPAEEPSMSEEEVEDMLEEAKARLSGYDTELGRLKADLENVKSLVMKGYCPTCKRPIDGAEYAAHLQEAEAKYEEARRRRQETAEEIRDLERARAEIEDYAKRRLQLEGLEGKATEVEDSLFDAEQRLEEARGRERELSERRARAAEAAERYRSVEGEYRECEAQISKKEAERDGILRRKAALEQEIAMEREKLVDLKEEAERLEGEKRKAERLGWHAEWLVKYFAAALERIELTVMNAVRREFEEEFSKWFSYLVEDPSKGVRIDEDFTPLVTQDSYEQDVGNLSGGERTSLALAYRLALNRVVQRNSRIGADLLILDEPTDGFSKDQIAKMGDLLRELGLRQAVIVSHERELEGAVDHIFRIQKEGGRSRVRATTG
ncbi:MAG: SMC family ATPase [Candidatus Methanosuratincola petrocarbonis]